MHNKVKPMDQDKGRDNSSIRATFLTQSSLTDPRLEAMVRHLARLAAEDDYKIYRSSGVIPYSDPKKRDH